MTADSAIIFDPALVIPTGSYDADDFWMRFSDWTADERLCLAVHTYEVIVDWCGGAVWSPDWSEVPDYLRREVSARINKFVARTPISHTQPLLQLQSSPTHIARDGALAASLISDIVGITVSAPPDGIATSGEFWSESSKEIEIDGLKDTVPLIFKPNQRTRSDDRNEIQSFYRDNTIIIVGGKRESNVISNIQAVCGISEEDITWIESEPHKSPRDLDKKLKSFTGLKAHLVFIFGRVGHDSFEHIQKAASRTKYQLIQPEHESRIVSELSIRALASCAIEKCTEP